MRSAHDLGALSASDEAMTFYAGRGWKVWRGPCSALAPIGILSTAQEDGGTYILPDAVCLDMFGELTCGWRDGDVW